MGRKPGKYDEIIHKYPELPPEDLSHQEKVNAFKDKILAAEVHTADSLAREYRKLRRGTGNPIDEDFTETLIDLLGDDGITALKKECDKRVEAFEQMLAASHNADEPGWGMYGAGENTVRMPDGASVSVQKEPTGKVVNKEEFRLWCIKNGLETKLQLWPSSMNSMVKQMCIDGKEPPDGVEVFSITKVVLRGAND